MLGFLIAVNVLNFGYCLARQEDRTSRAVSVFAHMVNTPNAVRWGLSQGANAVEMDVHFDVVSGNPIKFQHSAGDEPCGCTCMCPGDGSKCPVECVCNSIWNETGSNCGAFSTAESMTLTLGSADIRDKLALIYIDSKVSDSMVNSNSMTEAGANLVKLFNKNVFGNGYLGQVIISIPEVKYIDYLKGALTEAAMTHEYVNRYFYTIDWEGSNEQKVWEALLQLKTENIVYSTGNWVCAATKGQGRGHGGYLDAIKSGIDRTAYAGVGIWTIDGPASYEDYLDAGVNFLITNTPKIAVDLVKSKGFYIPSPGYALLTRPVPVQVNSVFYSN